MRLEVGVLGATGMVGQQFIARLARHPWFAIRWLAASERSEGKSYAEAAPWRLATPVPDGVREMTVDACVPGRGPKVVFSALDAKAADVLEHEFAAAGHVVLSNARTHRMDPLVPLLVPEVNAAHLCLLDQQRRAKGWSGAVVTNPNCAAVVLAMALAPLRPFGLRSVMVTTMQAVSGAGYPGVPSLDILGNLIPYIGPLIGTIFAAILTMIGQLGSDFQTEILPTTISPILFSFQTVLLHLHKTEFRGGRLRRRRIP